MVNNEELLKDRIGLISNTEPCLLTRILEEIHLSRKEENTAAVVASITPRYIVEFIRGSKNWSTLGIDEINYKLVNLAWKKNFLNPIISKVFSYPNLEITLGGPFFNCIRRLTMEVKPK